jgi:hypothetical protein
MKDKVIIHYTNGKSYTIKNAVCEKVEWDRDWLNILKLRYRIAEEKDRFFTFSEYREPLICTGKLSANDVVAVESITEGKRIIHTRPGVNMSVQTDIKTAKKRCKQNRSEFHLELTGEDLVVFANSLQYPNLQWYSPTPENLEVRNIVNLGDVLDTCITSTGGEAEKAYAEDCRKFLEENFSKRLDSDFHKVLEDNKWDLYEDIDIDLEMGDSKTTYDPKKTILKWGDDELEGVCTEFEFKSVKDMTAKDKTHNIIYDDPLDTLKPPYPICSNHKPTKAILFNGPAGCGKDSTIAYLEENLGVELTRRECKDRLHELTMEYFDIEPELYWKLYNSRDLKEMPSVYYGLNHSKYMQLREVVKDFDYVCTGITWNISPRMAMIYISECAVKPELGENYFGKYRAEQVEKYGEVMVDGSCAAFEVNGEIRADEIDALIDKLGAENILLIKVNRPEFSFEGDSRRYVPSNKILNTYIVNNINGQEEAYNESVLNLVKNFLES